MKQFGFLGKRNVFKIELGEGNYCYSGKTRAVNSAITQPIFPSMCDIIANEKSYY